MDGKYVFCIESGIYTNSGDGYIPSNFTSSNKELLSKIAYYGYTLTSKSDYDYAVTQVMIWEALGDTYKSSNIPNYQTRKAQMMAQVNNYNTLPSWHDEQFDVKVGDSITLTDASGIFSRIQLASNPTGAQLHANGNQLKITPSATSNDGAITYKKVPTNQIDASIVYKKPQHQTLVEFHLEQNI
ncbi:thioester domain-containing protein [Mycoplasma sp. P36-A1]|uniref:thioester domain-containing protein n=1 Tax=Mycoplasma sp. P36-A1 TaxID=3252900 RepID=UPI003C2B996F